MATIFGLSSGAPPAGVAVIRLSGPATGSIVSAVAGGLPPPRRARLVRFRDPASGEEIDRGLVFLFPEPASFTGEDVAEFHLHGGRAVIARMVGVLSSFEGCRLAEPGEFTRRAFDNGKLDLTEAEGLADLIDSETEGQRRQALRQMEGGLRTRAEGWRTGILQAMALHAAELDFGDEEGVEEDLSGALGAVLTTVLADVEATLATSRIGERVRDGVRVVITGAPNVGKSSLLNALAGRDVAIVSTVAGTTRDAIEVRLDIDGIPVDLVDTAGLREARDEIECEGIRRSRQRIEGADLVLEVIDATERFDRAGEPLVPGPGALLRVANKIDLVGDASVVGSIGVSARTGEGVKDLVDALGRFVSETYGGFEGGVVARERQRRIVGEIAEALRAAIGLLGTSPELAAEELRRAGQAIGRLTGSIGVEEILGAVFSRFCIGK